MEAEKYSPVHLDPTEVDSKDALFLKRKWMELKSMAFGVIVGC